MVPEIVVNAVEELKDQVSIYQICLHLDIARSTYYRWKQHTQRIHQRNGGNNKWVNNVINTSFDMATERLQHYSIER